MTIKTLGMGIVKFLKTKTPRKTLTVDKGAARIAEINRKIKQYKGPKQDITEDYIQEVADIYAGKWKGKK